MLRYLLLLVSCFLIVRVNAQYKNDNVLYRTIYPQDLCRELEKNPGYVLLDVRSAGEYSDTSQMAGLNIGHLQGAMNLDIRQIGQRFHQIRSFKNDPVFVYCSHSQRSRRVSKMLADSGFTNIININGGLTALHALNPLEKACINAMLQTSNTYSIITAPELCRKMAGKFNGVFLLDVRADSAWNRTSQLEKVNSFGYLKGTKHISYEKLKEEWKTLPKEKEIIITDMDGVDAALAAKFLKDNGFRKVSFLLEGMNRWLLSDPSEWGCADPYVSVVPYKIISAAQLPKFMARQTKAVMVDLRTAEEFDNKHKDAFRNVGYIRNAINVPASDLASKLEALGPHKNDPIILYAFSGGNEVYEAARKLADKGFSEVYVLAGGLFNLRWTAANVPGMTGLNEWVKEIPAENQ